jgi:hypothetical protein
MNRPPDQNPEDTRPLWPLVRLFGILTDIAAQEDATGLDVEPAVPTDAGADLVPGATSRLIEAGVDQSEKEAA